MSYPEECWVITAKQPTIPFVIVLCPREGYPPEHVLAPRCNCESHTLSSLNDIMIVQLHESLNCIVLSNWLNIKDIGRLDSAFCHARSRTAFLRCLQCKSLLFKQLVPLSNRILTWLMSRQLKLVYIRCDSYFHTHLLADYLRLFGDYIRKVKCTGKKTSAGQDKSLDKGLDKSVEQLSVSIQMTSVMYLIAVHCRKLRILQCEDSYLDDAFQEMVWCNPALEEVYLTNVLFWGKIQQMQKVAFPNVKIFQASSAGRCTNLWSAKTFSAKLEEVQLTDNIDVEDVMTLVENTPGLRFLTLRNIKISDTVLQHLAVLLQNLEQIEITGNSVVTDIGLSYMGRNLSALIDLRLHDCKLLTDLSIAYIGEHCGHTLQKLSTDIRGDNVGALQSIAGKLAALTYLDVESKSKQLCSQGITFALIQACPQLQTLIVDTENAISVSSREFIKVLRPNLGICTL